MNSVIARLRESWKAALLHLCISTATALVAVAVILGVWYRGEFSDAQGVDGLVLIMIGVDVVLGPLITLIVFDPHKWGIRFDVAFIATMQLLALGYGLHTIHGGRPVYVVFNVNRFDLVSHKELDKESLVRVPKGMAPSPWKPRIVAARMPEDPSKRSDLLFSALRGGPDLPQLPEYYVPLEDEQAAMLAKTHPLGELKKINGLDEAEWQALLDGLGRTEEEIGYLPLLANARDGAVIVDRRSAEILGIRMLTPRFGSPESSHPDQPSALPAPSPVS